MSLFTWIPGHAPTANDIRGEVWRLGVRHHGEALAGARRELAEGNVAADRATLLRACIRALKSA